MRKLLSLTLLALVGSSAFAGGYRVSIQGQKQLAMGHTGVAVVNSAEIAFFNPAGMAYLDKKFNLSVGGNGLFANTKFQNSQYSSLRHHLRNVEARTSPEFPYYRAPTLRSQNRTWGLPLSSNKAIHHERQFLQPQAAAS